MQHYSRAYPRSGRWLVGFGWGTHRTPNPTKNLFARAHVLRQNKGPCDAWLVCVMWGDHDLESAQRQITLAIGTYLSLSKMLKSLKILGEWISTWDWRCARGTVGNVLPLYLCPQIWLTMLINNQSLLRTSFLTRRDTIDNAARDATGLSIAKQLQIRAFYHSYYM